MATLIRVAQFLALYVLSVALLLCFNLWVLSLGEFSSPSYALSFYFPLWLAFYSPVALLGGLISSWPSPRIDTRAHRLMLRYFALLILGLLEIAFVLDLWWPWILLEYLVISVSCFALRYHFARVGGQESAMTREA